MAIKKVTLNGLRGNYQSGYRVGDTVFRKYKKEWHIYTIASENSLKVRFVAGPRVVKAANAITYIHANPDLAQALAKAGKPLTTINDKIDNARWGLSDIEIHFNDKDGTIVGHKINVKTPEDIKAHKELVKERKEQYQKLPSFGAFLAFTDSHLTYLLSEEK